MKKVIYYLRGTADGSKIKYYYKSDKFYCLDPKFAMHFDNEEQASLFAESLTDHWHMIESYVTQVTFGGMGMGTF